MISMSDNFNEYNSDTIDNSNSDVQQKPHYDNYYADTVIQSEESAAPQTTAPGSYAYVSENAPKPKKHKKHSFLKVVAFILCLGIAGVGSVQGYKIYRDNKDGSGLSEPEREEKSSSASKDVELNYSDDAEEADMPSIISIAAREDAKPLPDIVDSIMPSVVGITANFEVTQTTTFFGWESDPRTSKMTFTGTGFVISEDGYIVTNAHVVYDSEYKSGEPIDVSVMFSDESEYEAKLVAYDVETDIAVLKIDQTGLTPAVIGNSDDLRVGELVIAVGNPLGFELFGSVTSGIVSALNRNISVNGKGMSLIQTDAAINSGNSGGPLLNSCGQVIGINSAKMSSSYGSGSVEGLGFAIPITDAKKIIDDLINYKYVKDRPQHGITCIDISESLSRYFNIPMGLWIKNIEEGSAADLAGIEVNDIILDVDGETVKTSEELNAIINKHKAGDTVTFTIYRRGEDLEFDVTLQETDNPNEKDDNSKKKEEKHQPATAAPRESDPYDDFLNPFMF
ncbi:MAG: trypsin-like peptidase domain-containing protein [Ruminococcus sp.]|nr:trypsin-like peptidase domain-containing protein [Ruminococcus sp.]